MKKKRKGEGEVTIKIDYSKIPELIMSPEARTFFEEKTKRHILELNLAFDAAIMRGGPKMMEDIQAISDDNAMRFASSSADYIAEKICVGYTDADAGERMIFILKNIEYLTQIRQRIFSKSEMERIGIQITREHNALV